MNILILTTQSKKARINGSTRACLQQKDSSVRLSILKSIEYKKASHLHLPDAKKVHNVSTDNKYTIRYVTSPSKSYVVNPKKGKINYNLAYRDFDRFFDKVSKQPITKFRM